VSREQVPNDPVDFLPTADPLLRAPSLEHAVTLPVLGVATRFESNSAYVLGVAEEAFGLWRASGAPPAEPSARVRVVVHEGSERVDGRAPVRHLCPDATRMIVQSPGSVAVADPERRESVAYVTTELAADREHFRAAVLEAITLALLAHLDRHPVHAAGVARGDRAVLLAGPSGSGKSTLAYLAETSGLTVLGDDRVWVQLEPAPRVWGWPGALRMTPDSVRHFPELARVGTTSVVGGKTKLAFRPPGARSHDAAGVVERGYDGRGGGAPLGPRSVERTDVCVLRRGTRASLEPLPRDAVADALRRVDAGFDRFPERHDAVVHALAAHDGWRLTLSADPRDALPFLREMLDAE
jgi:hypothetical protein